MLRAAPRRCARVSALALLGAVLSLAGAQRAEALGCHPGDRPEFGADFLDHDTSSTPPAPTLPAPPRSVRKSCPRETPSHSDRPAIERPDAVSAPELGDATRPLAWVVAEEPRLSPLLAAWRPERPPRRHLF